MTLISKQILIILATLLLVSCNRNYLSSDIDNIAKLDRRGADEVLHNKDAEQPLPPQADLIFPDLEPILQAPAAPEILNNKKVTISITENVNVKDVLMEMARLAELDIEIDPQISGGVILQVTERPVSEVIERICDLADLRYSVDRGVLRVERDKPIFESYHLDFINLIRSNQGSIRVNMSLGGEQTDIVRDSGSSSSVTSSYEGNLWSRIEADIQQIINATRVPNSTTTKSDSDSSSPTSTGANILTINRDANLITVYANSRTHKAIKTYLDRVSTNVSAQANFEVKIVELELRDDYKSGVDWGIVRKWLGDNSTFNFSASPIEANFLANMGDLTLEMTLDDGQSHLSNLIKALNMFGTTRTISSPRINAMNNQQAILSFAQNYVYFRVTVDNTTTPNSDTTQTTVNSEVQTVPVGLILTLQPTINLDSSEITLNVRPTISRIVNFVSDPSIAFTVQSLQQSGSTITDETLQALDSKIPVVEVKELDSVLKMKSDQIMVIGGMMEERSLNYDSGVPGFSEIPLAGNLFKSRSKATSTVQTIIFIKASIVPGSNVTADDKKFYRRVSRENNPLRFED